MGVGPRMAQPGLVRTVPWYCSATYSTLVNEGIRIRKEIRLDQLEGFDQLETGLDLGQLVIGLDMICYYLIGPSLGGQECSLYKGR